MKKCRTCKHFDPDVDLGVEPFGECARIPSAADLEEVHGVRSWEIGQTLVSWDKRKELAYTRDGEMYASYLYVHPDFGCVQHKKARP